MTQMKTHAALKWAIVVSVGSGFSRRRLTLEPGRIRGPRYLTADRMPSAFGEASVRFQRTCRS